MYIDLSSQNWMAFYDFVIHISRLPVSIKQNRIKDEIQNSNTINYFFN